MSREAIAAALARDDLPSGERLVAFSLASFAGRRRPGVAGRAGGRRACGAESQPLPARPRPARPARAGGRRGGRVGAWSREHARAAIRGAGAVVGRRDQRRAVRGGPVAQRRLAGLRGCVLAAMAALADESGVVRGLSGVELCAAASVDDHTYRRARKELLESGELILVHRACGRGNTNVWEVRPPGVVAAAREPGGRPGAWRRPQGRGRCSPPSPGRLRTRPTLTAALWRIQCGGVMAAAAGSPGLKTVLL